MEKIVASYDFKCNYCLAVVEINDNIQPMCVVCGYTMTRIWSVPSIKFNESGYYSTGG